RDQPRVRLVPAFGYNERAAIGAVAAALGRVVAGVERQLAGVCPGRHGHRVVAGAEMEVGEAECGEGDERQGDDSRWAKRFGSRGFHRFSFRRVRWLDARSAAAGGHRREVAAMLLPAADPLSYSGRRRRGRTWSTFN